MIRFVAINAMILFQSSLQIHRVSFGREISNPNPTGSTGFASGCGSSCGFKLNHLRSEWQFFSALACVVFPPLPNSADNLPHPKFTAFIDALLWSSFGARFPFPA
jgi:hypothetical protein